jgi:drug/metabolite transporter (DMT)-like permease
MILWGLRRGEPMHARQLLGLTLAFGGLVLLLLPGLAAPPIGGAVLMLCAGIAWGAYSLRGKAVADPIAATAGNFLRAAPITLLLGLTAFAGVRDASAAGIAYAVASGAITSGVGYAIWYAALPGLRAVSAATVQLSVPVLTAIAGILILGESITLRFVIASIAVLGGIAIVTASNR